MKNKKHYLVTGGSGFIGSQLCKTLLEKEQRVTVLTRTPQKTKAKFSAQLGSLADHLVCIGHLDDFNQSVDIIINLAGQGIMDKRWTETIKQQLLDSRLNTTQAVVDYVKRCKNKPELVISGSAIGYYGMQHGDIRLDETAQGDHSFASQLCIEWEDKAKALEVFGIRTCYLRTGIVLGKGGALAKMLPPFKLGLGGKIGSGQQWMSWIHLNDLLNIIHFICDNETIEGVTNATASNPVRNREFTKILGKMLKRPTFIPMPAIVLKLMLGEGAEELLLAGQRVVPKKMQEAGFVFQFPELEKAMKDVIQN
ncbi:MAG: TIGR01777 family oxidoreductase [Cocleimonas sp.]|nr:TIGR01777 family oxidoreductase [Cocleimonas sp.]